MLKVNLWIAREVAVIIGFTDYCIYHNLSYQDEVAKELQESCAKTTTYGNIMSKLSRVLTHYGITNVKPPQLRDQGTRCIDIARIPSDVRTQLGSLRRAWKLSPLEADPELADRSGSGSAVGDFDQGDGNITSSMAGSQLELQKNESEHSETIQVGETPEPQSSNMTAFDGPGDIPTVSPVSPPDVDDVLDRFTSPECGSPSASSAKRAARKKRYPTPEDPTDFEYEPDAKRLQNTGKPSGRTVANVTKKTKAAAVTKGTAIPGGVLDRKTSTPKACAHLEFRDKPAPIVIFDDEFEQNQRVEMPIAAIESPCCPEQRSVAAPNEGVYKRGAGTMSEAGYDAIESPPKRHKTGKTTLESVDHKVDACLSILRNLVTHLPSLPEETAEHIHQLIRTSRDTEGSILENLITDLESQRTLKVKYRDMVRKLVGFVDLSNGAVFPKTPQQNEVDRAWMTIQEHIVSIVGPNNIRPMLSLSSAGYIAASAENITHHRIPGEQLPAYVESLAGPLKCPQAQQLLFSALLCRWVFADPEVMLKDMHSDAMLGMYTGTLNSASTSVEGLTRVQQYDQVATKLLFEDPIFKTTKIAQQNERIQTRFGTMAKKLCAPSKIPSNMQPDRFAKEVIDFKMQLLMSPKEYRIHYARPGMTFDASTMRAFDHTNEPIGDGKAAGKKILLCLFPALICQDPEALKEDSKIEDVLVKNKRFLPTFEETLAPVINAQLSKAVVLMPTHEAQK